MTDETHVDETKDGTSRLAWQRIVEHKVIQWAIGYLGAALAVAQLGDIVAEALQWPDGVWRGLVVTLIVGFPIAVTVAWYHGHRGLTRISAGEMSIVSVLLLIGALFFVATFRGGAGGAASADAAASPSVVPPPAGRPTEGDSRTANSVVVLPFINNSSDSEQEHFANGLADQLRDALDRIRDLRVIGQTSSFYFKGRTEDLRTIGERLGVEHVVEGSVQKVGERLVINAELNNAMTGYREWGERYEGTIDDIWDFQDSITKSVAEALQITLGLGDLGRRAGMTRNVDAYEAFIRGNRGALATSAADLGPAIAELERAVEIDPMFALAWARLSQMYAIGVEIEDASGGNAQPWQRRSADALARARDLAPETAPVVSASATVAADRGDYSEAERLFRRALETDPDPTVTLTFGEFLLYVGKARESIEYLAAAKRNDPLNPAPAFFLGAALDASGDPEAALAEYRALEGIVDEASSSAPHALALRAALGTRDRTTIDRKVAQLLEIDFAQHDIFSAIAPQLDQPQEALRVLEQFVGDPAHSTGISKMVLAAWAAYFGGSDLALNLLSQVNTGPGRSRWTGVFKDVRRLPGFKDYMRDQGYIDYWHTNGWGDFCRPIDADDFVCN